MKEGKIMRIFNLIEDAEWGPSGIILCDNDQITTEMLQEKIHAVKIIYQCEANMKDQYVNTDKRLSDIISRLPKAWKVTFYEAEDIFI